MIRKLHSHLPTLARSASRIFQRARSCLEMGNGGVVTESQNESSIQGQDSGLEYVYLYIYIITYLCKNSLWEVNQQATTASYNQ